MKRFFNYILLAFSFSFLAGCKKYVEIPPPDNQLIASSVFADDKTATATVAGLYSRINGFNSSFGNFIANFTPSMSADEFYYAFSSADLDEFRDNKLTSPNTYLSNAWSNLYSYIYHANSIVEGLGGSTALTPAVKKQLMGEAKFLRAFFYFYLVNYFNDVPLILDTDYQKNTSMARTPAAQVYAAILADLVAAQADLTDAYPSAERTRANKAAASALLARVYLYQQQYDKAEAEATKVISDARYQLLTDLSKIFLKNSNEAILQWQTVNTSTAGVNTWEGFSIVPASATSTPLYQAHPNFVAAFETGDKRKDNWIKSFTNTSGTVYYPFKYKIRTKTPVDEYSMVLRFAEQYLIRAEARARQNNLVGAKADVDTIRKRAGLAVLPDNLSQADMLLAIEKERRMELFAEWGHRWLDLRRTGRSMAVLGPVKPGLEVTDLLYPIPLSARNTNPNLTQNPGYN